MVGRAFTTSVTLALSTGVLWLIVTAAFAVMLFVIWFVIDRWREDRAEMRRLRAREAARDEWRRRHGDGGYGAGDRNA